MIIPTESCIARHSFFPWHTFLVVVMIIAHNASRFSPLFATLLNSIHSVQVCFVFPQLPLLSGLGKHPNLCISANPVQKTSVYEKSTVGFMKSGKKKENKRETSGLGKGFEMLAVAQVRKHFLILKY